MLLIRPKGGCNVASSVGPRAPCASQASSTHDSSFIRPKRTISVAGGRREGNECTSIVSAIGGG